MPPQAALSQLTALSNTEGPGSVPQSKFRDQEACEHLTVIWLIFPVFDQIAAFIQQNE
jgi:hypothetical protein